MRQTMKMMILAAAVVVLCLVRTPGALAEAAGRTNGTPNVRRGLTVEDLGAPLASMRVSRPFAFRSVATGELHLCAFLMAMNRTDLVKDPPIQLYDLNLRTGKANLVTGCRGRFQRAIVHSNGKLYVGTGRPAELMSYDPETGLAQALGSVSENFYHETSVVAEGSDRAVYVGTRGGEVVRHLPHEGRLERLGQMDSASPGMCASLAADERYVYCALGPRPWRLAVYDRETESRGTHLQPGEGERNIRGAVEQGADGTLYYVRQNREAYVLRDGKPKRLGAPPVLSKERPRRIYDYGELAKGLGLQIDASRMRPTSLNNGAVTVRWRRSQEEWRTSTVSSAAMRPNAVRLLIRLPDGRLLGCTSTYFPVLCFDTGPKRPLHGVTAHGPFFIFDPKTGSYTVLGPAPWRAYAMARAGEKLYLGGDRAFFGVYDPAKPWSFRAHDPREHENANPDRQALKLKAPTTEYLVLAADERLYLGQRQAGRTRGGQLAWFDPATGASGGWREPFVDRYIEDLITINQKRLVVVSTAALKKNQTGRIFVLDTETGKLRGPLEPVSGPQSAGKLMDAGRDHVIGLVRQSKSGEDGSISWPSLVYKMNVLTGEVLFARVHPGKAFAGMLPTDLKTSAQSIESGPDGCGWLFIDRTLSRIHPSDGKIEKVMECDIAGRMLFVGRDLYLYNGGRLFFEEFAGLKRIREVVGNDAD